MTTFSAMPFCVRESASVCVVPFSLTHSLTHSLSLILHSLISLFLCFSLPLSLSRSNLFPSLSSLCLSLPSPPPPLALALSLYLSSPPPPHFAPSSRSLSLSLSPSRALSLACARAFSHTHLVVLPGSTRHDFRGTIPQGVAGGPRNQDYYYRHAYTYTGAPHYYGGTTANSENSVTVARMHRVTAEIRNAETQFAQIDRQRAGMCVVRVWSCTLCFFFSRLLFSIRLVPCFVCGAVRRVLCFGITAFCNNGAA